MTILIPNFSTLDLQVIKDYLRVDYEDDDLELTLMLESAKDFVRKDTHRTDEWLNNNTMASLLVLKLVADFYEHRFTTEDSSIRESEIYKNLLNNLTNYSRNL